MNPDLLPALMDILRNGEQRDLVAQEMVLGALQKLSLRSGTVVAVFFSSLQNHTHLLLFLSVFSKSLTSSFFLLFLRRSKHIKGSKEHYLLGQNTTCEFSDFFLLLQVCIFADIIISLCVLFFARHCNL